MNGDWKSLVGIGWTVGVQTLVGQEILSSPYPSRLATLQLVLGPFSGGKAAPAWRWRPAPFSAQVKNDWS